jgi:mRNA interferase RelE/StbE
MRIEYTKQAQKGIEKLPKDVKQLVKEAIEGLPKGDIKTMQGYSDGRKRLRVGKYRIIYRQVNENTVYILVMDVGSRGDIYK